LHFQLSVDHHEKKDYRKLKRMCWTLSLALYFIWLRGWSNIT